MKWAVSLLSPLYYGLHKFRNELYQRDLFEKIKTKAKVLSVGNISFGGTGKTPFVMWLLRQEMLKDKKIAVVGRPYKANFKGDYHLVGDYDLGRSEDFGDEAVMIARNFPKVDVYVGKSKADCAFLADQQDDYDLIILDDGFQHRRLHRDLDIVLLDSSVPSSDYHRLPIGRLREDLSALHRASLNVFTKLDEKKIEEITKLAKDFQLPVSPSIAFGFSLGKPTRITPSERLEVLEPSPSSYILVAGVGNPEQVEKSVAEVYGNPLASVFFDDHHIFNVKEAGDLNQKRENLGAKYIFCTEKDYFKMRAVLKNSSNLYFIPLNFRCLLGEEKLVEEISGLFT